MDDDHTMSFMDTLADHRERESPCDPDHLEWAKDAMKSLPEREREILRRRFGIGREEQTLKEIGDDMGVTRERVRQIQTNGLNRMAGRATDAMMCMFQKTLFPPNLCVEQARKRYRMDL
jgi:RNA polymerase primary sigma factor